tara:strand:- start:1657 stop:1863 length:207 start_codon:yes stop_codon:yes gene_type:complete
MKIESATLAGLNRAQTRLGKAAHATATAKSSLIDNKFEMINSKAQFEANSKVVSTSSEMLGTILDLKA